MPTPSPTPSPTPTPPPAVYSGSITQTTNVLATAQQNPQAQPTYVVTSTVSEIAKTFPNESYNATPAAEIESIETDTSPNKTYQITTAAYYTEQNVGPVTDLVELGYQTKDTNGVTTNVEYGTGNGIVDVLPETTGNFGPNTPTISISQSDTDNTTVNRSVASDGSYLETDTFGGGDSNQLSQSATLNSSFASQASGTQISFGPPQSSGSTATIPFSDTYQGQAGSGTVGDWYPSSPLSTETDVDGGSKAIPSACNVSSAIASSATLLTQTISSYDIVNGTTDAQQTQRYVVPTYGIVCVQATDAYTEYYDYSGQFGNANNPGLSSTPLETVVTTETIGEQSGPTPTYDRHRNLMRLQPLLAGFHANVTRVHLAHTRALIAAFQHRLGSVR
jgi:hypothetical protein